MQHQSLTDMQDCLSDNLSDRLTDITISFHELSATTTSEHLLSVLRWLRDDAKTRFQSLIDICGVDYPNRSPRFLVVYHLLSPFHNVRLRLKLATDSDTPVPSIVGLFRCAEWFEREAYDMYGLTFSDHPDLRRLLTDYGFEGYPLRKDYPLSGFSEVRYDSEQEQVIYEPINLRQEFRDFDFLSPWHSDALPTPDESAPLAGDEKAGEATKTDG